MIKPFKVTLFLVLVITAYFLLLPERERAQYFSDQEPNDDVTVLTLTGDNGGVKSDALPERQQKDFQDLAADIDTDSRQALEEQIGLLKQLESNNPGMLSEMVKKDMAVKVKLKAIFDEYQHLSFEKQLSAVDEALASFSLVADEKYFYARQYFLRQHLPNSFATEKTLALYFLPEVKASRVVQSLEKRQQHLAQREQYQAALKAFQLQLERERHEKYSQLSEVQWQEMSQEQIKRFKQDFFNGD